MYCRIQVNQLATSMAVLLLVPAMMRTAAEHHTLPRLVVVTSDLHYDVVIDKEARAQRGKILQTMSTPKYSSTAKCVCPPFPRS
jgi:retinol dehydrogenase-12